MIWMAIKLTAEFVVLVLAFAYMVEWQLKRVTLKQSLVDIRLVVKGIIDHFRKPKPGS